VGSMEEVKTEMRVVGKVESVSNPIPIVGGKMKKRGLSISVRVVTR